MTAPIDLFTVCVRPWTEDGEVAGYELHILGVGSTQLYPAPEPIDLQVAIQVMVIDYLDLAGIDHSKSGMEIVYWPLGGLPLLPERGDWHDHMTSVVQVLFKRMGDHIGNQSLHSEGIASGYVRALSLILGVNERDIFEMQEVSRRRPVKRRDGQGS